MTPVKEQQVGEYLEALASTSAVPGGGSAAALTAAMGASLVSMVAKLSARKAKADADRAALEEAVPKMDELAARLLELSQLDIEAYRGVIDTKKSGGSADQMAAAYERAAEVPLQTAAAAAQGIALAADVSKRAWQVTASDLAVASELLQTGMHGALGNVAINLPELKGEAAGRIEKQYLHLRSQVGHT